MGVLGGQAAVHKIDIQAESYTEKHFFLTLKPEDRFAKYAVDMKESTKKQICSLS